MATTDGDAAKRDNEALVVAAGVLDLALGGIRAALRGATGLLRRSDLATLAQDGHEELRSRGRLALDRHGGPPPSHLEVLAGRAVERRARSDA